MSAHVKPRPERVWTPMDKLITVTFTVILIIALYMGARLAIAEYTAWQQPAAEVAPTAIPPRPDVKVNTQTGAITHPAQPAAEPIAYPLTTADGAKGAWAPDQASFAIGVRHYRILDTRDGWQWIELDDGARLWVVPLGFPDAPPVVVSEPQAAQAASWVKPVQELGQPAAQETAQPQTENAARFVQPVATGGEASGAGRGLGTVADYLRREGK